MRKTHQEALKTLHILHHSSLGWSLLTVQIHSRTLGCTDWMLDSRASLWESLTSESGKGLSGASRACESFSKGTWTLWGDWCIGGVLRFLGAFLFPLGGIGCCLFVCLFFTGLAWKIAWAFMNSLMPPQVNFHLFLHISAAGTTLAGSHCILCTLWSAGAAVSVMILLANMSFFRHTHTHTPLPPLPSYTTHRSCSNLDAEQMKFVWAPLTTNPFVKVCTSHHNPSLCTSDQQSDFVLVFIFRLILHCSSQRGFNREERKHQEQICCCQLVGNGFRFHRQAY